MDSEELKFLASSFYMNPLLFSALFSSFVAQVFNRGFILVDDYFIFVALLEHKYPDYTIYRKLY